MNTVHVDDRTTELATIASNEMLLFLALREHNCCNAMNLVSLIETKSTERPRLSFFTLNSLCLTM